eukprot:TRINITY_DN47451_c0_g1_i1.p1 TRINITY_DN47451_c0_g1~~TRINITY_DN47451_c0_g1_i1.p1  ORF type:complete len:676 (+),score=107.34 TRINITY_DN47451_c0_g1_i1:43-2028(+)
MACTEHSSKDGADQWMGDSDDDAEYNESSDDDESRGIPTFPPTPCTAGGKIPIESDFHHCPRLQSFVRCGPHHRAELCVLNKSDIDTLQDIWHRYQDDLSWPRFEKKPVFSSRDFDRFYSIAQKVVDAMVDEYQVPMVLDQATISNTNHVGHPPHADNVQFDSVWWRGKRIRKEDEVRAAREGAYVLWRNEKTSYRSYSCSVALSDPNGYEGGEVQFFDKWASKDPIARYKCAEGCGVAFCGCHRNIHAVTGVTWGFRLVLLIWTRPPHVRVPDSQAHVCYFRPGTGLGCWLTTADIQQWLARKRGRGKAEWVPKDEDDDSCQCEKCVAERSKASWKDCLALEAESSTSAGNSSVGNSPRASDSSGGDKNGISVGAAKVSLSAEVSALKERESLQHCPRPHPKVLCCPHKRVELRSVISKTDVERMYQIWERHQDDLSKPWYKKKPTFSQREFEDFRRISQKVVDAMSEAYQQPLILDQAAVNSTNRHGHPPHADNVQFDSVWWKGQQIRERDEVRAAQNGAEVLFKSSRTSYRNYSATVALSDPWEYGAGELEFFNAWGEKDPVEQHRLERGNGMAFCGCQKSIHAVRGVKWGFRLVLLVWTRPPGVEVPDDQKHVCYFRQGSGLSIWLTTSDLLNYPQHGKKKQKWVPVQKPEENDRAE